MNWYATIWLTNAQQVTFPYFDDYNSIYLRLGLIDFKVPIVQHLRVANEREN